MTGEKWNKDRPDIEILPMIEDQYHTRGTVGCRPENRCHVCQINASSLNNFLVKLCFWNCYLRVRILRGSKSYATDLYYSHLVNPCAVNVECI